MLVFPSALFAKADGPPPGPAVPIDPAALFTGGVAGGYYNFTDAASLAVNADGTGGVPVVGTACRSVLDKSPNGNRLRNTVTSVIRRANGIETSGAGYGLFNTAGGFGDWPNIPQPFEIVARLELLAGETIDDRIIHSGSLALLLAGTASGKVRGYAGAYGTEFAPGLATEFTIDLLFNGAASRAGINTDAPAAGANPGTNALGDIFLGSDGGGNAPTQTRFEHLLVIGRALTAAERAGVKLWMEA